jgi:hypothetical protein
MAQTDDQPRTTEQVPDEQTNAQNEAQRVTEGLPVKLGYLFAAVALVGLCVGAVVAVIGDTSHISIGGTVAAISAGLLAATALLGMLVVFRRKGTTPAEVTDPKHNSAKSPNGKPRTSPASAKRPSPARS